MSSTLLDSIIASHGKPVILSENHDLSSIDWRAGSTDQAEMIKISSAVGEKGMIERALSRANLDVTNGKVSLMVAGENSWHKLGVNVAEAVNSLQALELSGLGKWTVIKIPANFDFSGDIRTSAETFILFRSDTGAQLGSTGKVYQPIQNSEMFGFLDDVLGQFGAKYSSAGAVDGGRQVFMTVELPEQAFALGSDRVLPRCVFVGDHSGKATDKCFPTTHRPVCANTTRLALKADADKGIRIRHTGDIRGKILDAQRALGLAVESFQEFKGAAEVMARTPIDIREYANGVLDSVLDITAAQAKLGTDVLASTIETTQANRELASKSLEKQIKRRAEILEDILDRYESSTNGVGGMRGTAWAGYNAVSEHANHNKIGRQVGSPEDRQSRRMESVLMGAGDSMIQAAYSLATR